MNSKFLIVILVIVMTSGYFSLGDNCDPTFDDTFDRDEWDTIVTTRDTIIDGKDTTYKHYRILPVTYESSDYIHMKKGIRIPPLDQNSFQADGEVQYSFDFKYDIRESYEVTALNNVIVKLDEFYTSGPHSSLTTEQLISNILKNIFFNLEAMGFRNGAISVPSCWKKTPLFGPAGWATGFDYINESQFPPSSIYKWEPCGDTCCLLTFSFNRLSDSTMELQDYTLSTDDDPCPYCPIPVCGSIPEDFGIMDALSETNLGCYCDNPFIIGLGFSSGLSFNIDTLEYRFSYYSSDCDGHDEIYISNINSVDLDNNKTNCEIIEMGIKALIDDYESKGFFTADTSYIKFLLPSCWENATNSGTRACNWDNCCTVEYEIIKSGSSYTRNTFSLTPGIAGCDTACSYICDCLDFGMNFKRSLLQENENYKFESIVIPNPTGGLTTIRLEGNIESELLLEVYSLEGINVITLKGMNNEFSFDISNLPEGTYHYRVQENGNLITGGKFIIQR